ncbi:hypothetical protein CPB84DRAFT_1798039 [Gymnopilus junonius]|uniref:Uncharacterized protein n=1 Tax=Gymnopilus junonius TaxID=109634 RepID=A0A9P5N861_GYMJU|nr:hypothetical protein CPB84DRAFT_1798039 [Gymnopilus junonius]
MPSASNSEASTFLFFNHCFECIIVGHKHEGRRFRVQNLHFTIDRILSICQTFLCSISESEAIFRIQAAVHIGSNGQFLRHDRLRSEGRVQKAGLLQLY